MISIYKEALKDALYPKGTGTLTKRNRYLFPSVPEEMSKEDIRKLRRRLHLSSQVFADILGVSSKTVQAWESGVNTPSGPALRLMNAIRKHPDILIEAGMLEERFR